MQEYVVKPPIPDLDDWDINTEVVVALCYSILICSKLLVLGRHAVFSINIKAKSESNSCVLQGLKKPKPVLGFYTEFKLPEGKKHFSARVKHIRTPNEVCYVT